MMRAGRVLAALTAEGFALELDPRLMSKVQAASRMLETDAEAADRRVNSIAAECLAAGRPLYPFQKAGVRWLASRPFGLLADEMGLGKTIEILMALPAMAPVLVVCPKIAKGTWKRELDKWRPDYLRITEIPNRASFQWPMPGQVIIVNYDILPDAVDCKHCKNSARVMGWKTQYVQGWIPCPQCSDRRRAALPPEGVRLIGDEIHVTKSGSAGRTKNWRALSSGVIARAGTVWVATGTPLMNEAPELWAILEGAGLSREAFGSWTHYKDIMGGSIVDFSKEQNGSKKSTVWAKLPRDSAEVARCLSKVMLRRKRIEVLPDLPVKRWEARQVDCLTASQRKEIDSIMAGVDWALLEEPEAWRDIQLFSHLRETLSRAKTPAMLEIVKKEFTHTPLIVFSAHRAPIDELAKLPGWATITGDTESDIRTQYENAFQTGNLNGIGLTIGAGGVAMTLTRSSNVLFVDQHPNPAANAQAEDRACRIGQTRGVLVTVLVADHDIDRRIATILARKQALIDETIERARESQWPEAHRDAMFRLQSAFSFAGKAVK
jgi:SNF2 family DNA or RNA helicase